MGNHDGAAAAMDVMDMQLPGAHPRTHLAEALKIKEVGEIAYMQQALGETLTWIKGNPGEFLQLTALRFIHFWFGPLHRPFATAYNTLLTILGCLGARRIFPRISVPQRAAILIPLATYPLIYYLVPYMIRYRTPLDWILLILAGCEVMSWIQRLQPAYPIAKMSQTRAGRPG